MSDDRFDRSRLRVRPLSERLHDLDLKALKPLARSGTVHESLRSVAARILAAREKGKPVILMAGGHVVRSGVQRYIIDLLEKGFVSCLAMNGSVLVHDFELSLIGATTESVARYIRDGQFGLWEETGRINDIVNKAFASGGMGMGEAVGKAIEEGDFPFSGTSLLAACYRLKVPATVHIGIGYDIIHEHPNFDGAAAGETSYRDFLRFAKIIERLEGGVVMNFGSAVMAPEVYLKALSMARNVAGREDRAIRSFTTLVCDLYPLPGDVSREPAPDDPAYYFRPWKTMLVRTVADGGESFYVRGRHGDTIPALWTALHDNTD
ncbi:MAG: GSU2086 family protein [Thermodesulfovibrionales bacterium]